MTLKIRNVSRKDEGLYRCMITFANKTVRSTAQLTIYHKVPVVTIIAGKCVPYTSGFCSAYFQQTNNLIFEEHRHPNGIVDKQLEHLINKLTKSNKLSEK